MPLKPSFRVPATAAEAIGIQKRLRDRVVRKGALKPRLVAGADVSYKNDVARAVFVVMRDLEPIEQVIVTEPVPFPYIPGLLSFREIPPLLSAWRKLKTRPEVIIVDGQGIAHPRRLGIASHLGLVLGVPTIGCAKSRLCGEHDEPGAKRGSWTPLVHKGETVGAALRTRDGCNVVYVSTGHLIGLESAISVVLACAPRYRLPEPQRLADQLTKQ
ncbi:MAG: deoxyribonuclease V [Planctomycetes bacterium]|nr:deoxyribonuclease V [Planctomycetota bacterium]